jgi:hypothetical protein
MTTLFLDLFGMLPWPNDYTGAASVLDGIEKWMSVAYDDDQLH